MNFQSCSDLSLLLSTWFFTLPSLVYFAPIVDVHLAIFSVNHPWKHLEANVRGLRCVTLQWIFVLLTPCVCSFWILSTQYIRYCKIPLTGVWQSHLGDGKTFQLKTVKIWPHEVNTTSYVKNVCFRGEVVIIKWCCQKTSCQAVVILLSSSFHLTVDSQQDDIKLNKQLLGIFDYHSQNSMCGWVGLVCLIGLNQWGLVCLV